MTLSMEDKCELRQFTEGMIVDEFGTEEISYIVYCLQDHLPKPDKKDETTNEKMSYDEARRWYRNTVMPFGTYEGSNIQSVPLNYLEWLSNQKDFRRELLRFMKSDYYRSLTRNDSSTN